MPLRDPLIALEAWGTEIHQLLADQIRPTTTIRFCANTRLSAMSNLFCQKLCRRFRLDIASDSSLPWHIIDADD